MADGDPTGPPICEVCGGPNARGYNRCPDCPRRGKPTAPALTADPQWSDARVVGHVRLPTDEMRWVVEQVDGTQHRVVAVVVQDDWETPHVPVPETAGLRLVCPYCGDEFTAELTYTAQYSEHRDLTGYECDNYKCDARWTARGDVARLPRSLCAT